MSGSHSRVTKKSRASRSEETKWITRRVYTFAVKRRVYSADGLNVVSLRRTCLRKRRRERSFDGYVRYRCQRYRWLPPRVLFLRSLRKGHTVFATSVYFFSLSPSGSSHPTLVQCPKVCCSLQSHCLSSAVSFCVCTSFLALPTAAYPHRPRPSRPASCKENYSGLLFI